MFNEILATFLLLFVCFGLPPYNFSQEFQTFTKEYRKDYKKTYILGRDIDWVTLFKSYNRFHDNLNFIKNHDNLTYQVGINEFLDKSPGDFGYIKGEYSEKFRDKVQTYRVSDFEYLPTEIDWRERGLVTPIKNQKECGSCWAFSAVGTMEGQHAKKTGKLVSLSEQELVDCVADCAGCGGGWPSKAIEFTMDSGEEKESVYPYTAINGICKYNDTKIAAKFRGIMEVSRNNSDALLDAVANVGPISVAISVDNGFQAYKSGVYYSPNCSQTEIDHAVTVVGYGVSNDNHPYYIIKNSWGESWGMKGYMYFSRKIPNMCGIALDACFPVV